MMMMVETRETREALLQRVADLRAEIATTREAIESAKASVYEPRIRELEEELADMQKTLLEMRASIAASSSRRWHRWPIGWIAIAILAIVVVMDSR